MLIPRKSGNPGKKRGGIVRIDPLPVNIISAIFSSNIVEYAGLFRQAIFSKTHYYMQILGE